jgi:hypothetical protein
MADQDRPNQNANKAKAEGERSAADVNRGTGSPPDEHPERSYPAGERSGTGGISNRPVSDEVESQEELPERGTHKNDTSNPGSTRREGDYSRDER